MRDKNACSSSDGIAMIRPFSVVISASEIPLDSTFGSPVPNYVIKANVPMMPVTVPSRPSNGADVAQIATNGSQPCRRKREDSIC